LHKAIEPLFSQIRRLIGEPFRKTTLLTASYFRLRDAVRSRSLTEWVLYRTGPVRRSHSRTGRPACMGLGKVFVAKWSSRRKVTFHKSVTANSKTTNANKLAAISNAFLAGQSNITTSLALASTNDKTTADAVSRVVDMFLLSEAINCPSKLPIEDPVRGKELFRKQDTTCYPILTRRDDGNDTRSWHPLHYHCFGMRSVDLSIRSLARAQSIYAQSASFEGSGVAVKTRLELLRTLHELGHTVLLLARSPSRENSYVVLSKSNAGSALVRVNRRKARHASETHTSTYARARGPQGERFVCD